MTVRCVSWASTGNGAGWRLRDIVSRCPTEAKTKVNSSFLPVLEVRLALLNEGSHTFFLVFGGKERVEGSALKEDALRQRGLEGGVHCLFRTL